MPFLPLRKVADPTARSLASEWLASLTAALDDASTDRSRLVRDTLTALYYPEFVDNWDTAIEDKALPHATRLALTAMDPQAVTLEPEYYGDCENDRFQRVKPLLW